VRDEPSRVMVMQILLSEICVFYSNNNLAD